MFQSVWLNYFVTNVTTAFLIYLLTFNLMTLPCGMVDRSNPRQLETTKSNCTDLYGLIGGNLSNPFR